MTGTRAFAVHSSSSFSGVLSGLRSLDSVPPVLSSGLHTLAQSKRCETNVSASAIAMLTLAHCALAAPPMALALILGVW